MSTVVALLVPLVAAGAIAGWFGLKILDSPASTAFLLTFVVGTNASPVMRQTFGLPEFVLPLSALVIFVALLHTLSGRRDRRTTDLTSGPTPSAPRTLAFAGFAALAMLYLSAALGPFISVDATAASQSFQLLNEHMIIVAAVIAVCWQPAGLHAALLGLAAAGTTLSIVTNVQFLTGTRDSDAMGFGTWNQETIGGIGDALRAAGPFSDDPNAYALYLVVAAGAAIGIALAARLRRSNSATSPIQPDAVVVRVMIASVASIAMAVVHTASRGGLLALAIVVGAALAVRGLDRRTLGISALIGVALVLGPFGVGDRLLSLGAAPSLATDAPEVDSGLLGRASEMIAAVDMFTDNPVAGVGFGTYNDRYLDYSRAIGLDGRFETRSAHSFPLEVAAEQGLIGVFAWTAFSVCAVTIVRRMRRRRADVATPLALSLLGFATASIFLHDVHPRLLWSLVAMTVAAGAMVDRRQWSPSASRADAPIRVAMVIQSYVPAVGGAERQLANLMPLFVAQGIQPLVVTRSMLGRPRFDEVDGVPVERIPVGGPKPIQSLMYVVRARATLRRFDPHVVHAFDTLTPTSIALGHARRTGTPVVTKILRSGELGDLHRLVLKPFGRARRRRLLRGVDRFVAISADIEDELRALGVDDERIALVPNGVDTDRFRPPASRVRRAETQPLTVIATGRLAPEKRLVHLAQRWTRVTDEFPGTTLSIVGDGPEADALDRFDDVIVHGRRDDIDEMLRHADVYVSVSAAEGLSNSLLEAMSTGLPCVLTDVGGVSDVVTTRNQGVKVAADDIDGVVDEIIAVLGSVRRRRTMRRSSRQRVQRAFSLHATANDLVGLYRVLALSGDRVDVAGGGEVDDVSFDSVAMDESIETSTTLSGSGALR